KKTNNFNTESKPQQGLNIFVHWQTKTVIKIKPSLCDISILKKKCYGTNVIFTMPPRKWHLNNLENRYSDSYYY
ncbi:hypothetical protein HID58_053315, partial [Brassica napus]